MTFWLMLAGFLGATNAGRVAVGLGEGRAPRRTLATVIGAGAALILAGVLLADPLLDALDISPESFRIAAGIVLAAVGAATLVRPRPGGPAGALLVTPELACMAIAASADEGIGPALAGLRAPLAERSVCLGGILLDRQAIGAADPRERGAWFDGGYTQMDDQQHAMAALIGTGEALR